MDRGHEVAQLSAIRRRVSALDCRGWLLGAEGEGMAIYSESADGAQVAIFHATRHATQDEMEFAACAPGDMRFLLGLLERAIRALRPPEPAEPPREERAGKNHAAEAAMLCQKPVFKRFLIEQHGLESPASDERAAQKMRSLLGVTSRKEINESEDVRARWLSLRAAFFQWKGRAVA